MTLDQKTADLMLTDLPAWEATLDERQKQIYERTFKYETAESLPAAKQRFQAVSAVAAYTGHDVREVSRRWEDWYIPAFAADQKVGLGRREGVQDFNEFFSLLAERASLNNKKRGWQAEAEQAAFTAALEGRPMLDALREWQGVDAGSQMKDRLAITPAFMTAYRESSRELRPYRDLIEKSLPAMQRSVRSGTSPEDAATLEELAFSVADSQGTARNLLKQAIISRAQAFGEASGERGVPGTGLASAVRILDKATERYKPIGAIDPQRLAWKEPITTPEQAKQALEAELQIRQSEMTQSALAVEVAGFLPTEPTRELTSEEAALVGSQIGRYKEMIKAMRELKQVATSTDPLNKSPLGTMASTLGSSVGIGVALSSGLPGALMVAGGYANMEFNELLTEYPDMDPEAAMQISLFSGAMQSAFDKAQLFGALKYAPSLGRVLTGRASRELSKNILIEGAVLYTGENIIEGLQDLTTPVLQQAAHELSMSVPQVDWQSEMTDFWNSRIDVALGMIPLTLLGVGAKTVATKQQINQILSDNQILGLAGIPESWRIKTLELARDGRTEEAQAALKEAWQHRDPAIAAEFGDLESARNQQAATTFEAAQRLGLMPHIRRDNEGFLVRDADGNVARFSDWEQTREAVQGHFNETEMQEIDAVARMADRFISTTPDSLDGGEEFNLSPGRRASLESQVQEGRITPEQYAESAVVAGMLEGMTREEAMKTTWAVLGDNEVEQKEGVRRSVSDIMRGGNVLTVVEEGVEGRWKAALEVGRYTREQGIGWVRLAESAMGETLLPAEGEISPRQLTEAISKIVVADVFGRRKDGSRLPAGIVSQGVMAAAANNAEATGLRAFLRAFRAFFAQVMGRARALRRARAEGKLTGEWETMLDDLLGIDSQQRFERAAEAEAQAMADEWVDEGDFEGYQNQTTGDASFSLVSRRFLPADYPASLEKTIVSTTVSKLKKHPQYDDAKRGGDGAAAFGVVDETLKDSKVDELREIIAGRPVIWVPVMHLDTGRRANALPMAYAEELSFRLGGNVAEDIVKVSGAANTGAAVHDRFANEQTFDGPVTVGGLYVVVDDNHTSGDTLASLIDHIQAGGGEVIAATTLANSQSQNYLKARPSDITKLLDKAGLDEASFEREFGYPVQAFTGSEAYRLANLDKGRGIEWLRGRIPSKRSQADSRGGSEGSSEASGTEELTHSLRAIRPGEAIDRALSSRLNAPEKRITFFSRARDAVARLSLDSLTWRGDVIEGTDTLEQRDAAVASLERERRFRQRSRQRELIEEGMSSLQPGLLAVYQRDLSTLEDHPLVKAMLNDHGKLMSRSRAEKLGKLDTDGTGNAGDFDGAPWLPPQWYSAQGGIMPDVMAQNLYDAGLLNQATPDALWDALGRVISGTRSMNQSIRDARAAVRDIGQEAYKKSMDEANQWFNKAVKDLPTNHEKMLAAFKTMDAILFAFPPEVRGRVGGSTKLASLKSDKARLKHMLDRIAKLDAELEKFLQEEIRADLDKIFDKAKPTGGKGEKAGGKIGVEGHRIFKAIGGMVDLSADEVTKRIEGINADIEQETDLAKVGDLLEEQQLLELFGGLNAKRADKSWLKSAAELKSAWDFAADVYATGRNKWKTQLEAQLAEVKDLQAQHIAAMGGKGTDARLSEIRAKAGKLDGVGLGALALVQVLERAYGTTHPLVRRWYGAARKATAQKGDAILGVRREFADLLKNSMPESSSIERETAVFELKTQRTVIAPKVEGVSVKDLEIPLEMAVKLVTGEAELKPFGLEEHHRDEIQAALDEHQAEESQRESITVQVVESKGMQADVPLTPMQAVHITMLWAQEMYRPGMERHGWTPETLEAIEAQLPPLAVQIRAFLASKYDSGYDAMNRVYQRMYGIDLPKVANYAPGTFMHEGMEIDSDPFGQGLIQNGGVRASFVKQRKQHMARPKWDSDALDLFFSHTSNVEHWKAFAELGREMRRVLLSAESKAATEAHGGKALESIMGKWVEIIERGGLETARDSSAWDKLARRIGSNRSVIALAYNLGTLMKQSTALFGAMIRMPVAAYGRGFMRLFLGRLPVKDIFRHDFIQRRVQSGYSPEARAAMAQLWDAPPSRRRHLLQQGMELIGYVDGIFTTGTAAIAYDYHYRQGIQAGLTPEQARGEALTAAEDVVSRVAQPSETIDKSVFEIGAGAWGRLGFMFASDARQKWALLQEAVVNRKQDPATLRRVLAFHLMSGIAIQTISSAWRDARDSDDDEVFDPKNWNPVSFLGGVILGPFSGVPLLSGALDTFSGRGELVEAALSVKDIATGKGDMKDVVTTLSGLAYMGTAGKYEDAATFLAVSAKVAKDILGISENVLE